MEPYQMGKMKVESVHVEVTCTTSSSDKSIFYPEWAKKKEEEGYKWD